VKLSKGEEIGMFRMGSTVAILFECPKEGYEFKHKAGDKLLLGQKLFDVKS